MLQAGFEMSLRSVIEELFIVSNATYTHDALLTHSCFPSTSDFTATVGDTNGLFIFYFFSL